MDAYSTANWAPAFTAIAGSSAALTGLLFVALSINLAHVIKGPGLIDRAVEVLVMLTATLILSTLLLMPSQPVASVGPEILSVAVLEIVVVGFLQIRAPRRVLRVSGRQFAMRVAGGHVGPVVLVAGGISLLAGTGGGLYLVVPGLVATMVAAIVGAWVMLVEIER